MTVSLKHVLMAGAGLSIAWTAPALAQDNVTAPPSAAIETAEAAPESGDIVVTARRRSEDISRIPLSVSAFSGETLQRKSILSTADLSRITPGLNFSLSGSSVNPVIAIRGQSRGLAGPGTPGVLTYFNEVPLPSYGSIFSTYDMDNIQVLKGPQGTLFGRNAIGGAVLTNSRKPTYDFSGYAEAEYGRFNSLRLEGAINLPIVADRLAVRIAGQATSTDGFTKTHVYAPWTLTGPFSSTPGTPLKNTRDYDEIDNKGLRVSVLAEPFEGLSSLTVLDYFQSRGRSNVVFQGLFPGTSPIYSLPAATLDAIGLGSLLNPNFHCGTSPSCDIDLAIAHAHGKNGRREAFTNMMPADRSEVFGISNTTSLELGENTQIKNIFAYRTTKNDNNTDIDGSALPIIDVAVRVRLRQITEELQLSGEAFDNRLKYVIGGFFYDVRPNGLGGREVDGIAVFSGLSVSTNMNYQREQTKAIYGQADYNLSDLVEGLSVTAGYRYSWDRTSGCAYLADYSLPNGGTPPPVGSFGFLPTERQCRTNSFTPDPNASPGSTIAEVFSQKSRKGTYTFALNWQATRDLLLYATTRRGYRPGGYNAPTVPAPIASVQTFGSETLTDVEIGTKGRYRVGDVGGNFSLALFRGKDKGYQYYQSTTGVPGLPSGGLLLNKADLIIKGVEGDFSLRPTSGLTLGANFAYTRVTIDRLTIPPEIAAAYEAAGLGDAVNVTSVFFTPKWQFNANLSYDYPDRVLGGVLGVNLDFHYQTSFVAGEISIDSYKTLDARISLAKLYDDRVTLSVFARNLLNEKYEIGPSASASGGGALSYILASPVTYGAAVRFNF